MEHLPQIVSCYDMVGRLTREAAGLLSLAEETPVFGGGGDASLIYLKKQCVTDSIETIYVNLYDFMLEEIKDVPAGSHGVIFTPWLHGNRCPFEDPYARGMFININLDTGKRDLIHAVIEGICYHLRWQLGLRGRR